MIEKRQAKRHEKPSLAAESLPMDAADLLVAYLEQIGVEYVFGVPGGAIEPLYNALARSARRGGPRSVVARHETGAAFMADGYARETGKIGVCCATSGPGATNLITGVACAYENEIPMLVITAQPSLLLMGRGRCRNPPVPVLIRLRCSALVHAIARSSPTRTNWKDN